jgi:hypothetical protein
MRRKKGWKETQREDRGKEEKEGKEGKKET